jgi:hypothetical protein
MNSLLLLSHSALLPSARQMSVTVNEGPGSGTRSPGGDLAWQRALQQARHVDFSDWFGPASASPDVIAEVARPAVVAAHPVELSVASAAGHVANRSSSNVETGRSRGPSSQLHVEQTDRHTHAMPDLRTTARTDTEAGSGTAPDSASQRSIDKLATFLSQRLRTSVVAVARFQSTTTFTGNVSEIASSPSFDIEPGSSLLEAIVHIDESDVDRTSTESEPSLAHSDVPAPQHEIRQPLRVYAEWSDEGIRVWVGADGDAFSLLPTLGKRLQQWLASEGETLLGVVCNGRTLWEDESLVRPAISSNLDSSSPAAEHASGARRCGPYSSDLSFKEYP